MNKLLETVVVEKCKRFAKEIWNVDFNVPVKISNKMSKSLGKYRAHIVRDFYISTVQVPIDIRFSIKLFEYHNEAAVDGVIKHELTHWYLGITHQPNGDGHPVFENELRRIGAPSTRKLPALGNKYVARCKCCGKIVVTRNSEMNVKKYCETTKYKSNCCKSTISYGGMIEYGDKSKGFLTALMNKQVEIPKAKETVKKTQKPKWKQLLGEFEKQEVAIKPAQRIKEVFSAMTINQRQLSELTDETFCERTLGLKYPFLKEFNNNNDRKVNGHNRYYSGTITIFGKQYIMCNDLYLKNVSKFEAYANV